MCVLACFWVLKADDGPGFWSEILLFELEAVDLCLKTRRGEGRANDVTVILANTGMTPLTTGTHPEEYIG